MTTSGSFTSYTSKTIILYPPIKRNPTAATAKRARTRRNWHRTHPQASEADQ